MLSSMILSVNTQKDNKGRGGLFHNYTMNPLTTPVVQAYPTHTCTTAEWNASAQPHMAVHTDPHCCRACRGGGPTGRGGAGEGRRRWKQHCQASSAADTHVHLCHTTTVLRSDHASSCEEERLTFHCLHNLDCPMRESVRGRGEGIFDVCTLL